jgi:hypothetical protein
VLVCVCHFFVVKYDFFFCGVNPLESGEGDSGNPEFGHSDMVKKKSGPRIVPPWILLNDLS